jgi:glycine/D-amino acid oxidase-like deaminating enzyme
MKIVVIGAGVIGTNIAYKLAKAGAEVVLVESGTPGAKASATSYAWLNSNNVEHPHYHSLRVLGMAAYHDLAAELGSDAWLHEIGNLHLAFTASAAETLVAKVARKQAKGYPAELLTADEMTELEPALSKLPDRPAAVAYYPTEGYLDTTTLIGRLLYAFGKLGGSLLRARAEALVRNAAGRVTGVRTSAGLIGCDEAVLCTGSVTDLLGEAGLRLSLRGDVGASVITRPLPISLSTLIHFPNLSVRPDGNGRIVIRAADVDKRVDTGNMTLDESAVTDLVGRATALLPLAGVDVAVDEVRVAFRPRPPDGFPIVGPVPAMPGAYLVCTHSGVTVGAIVGRLVARELVAGTDEPLLAEFRADRAITPAADDFESESATASGRPA